MFFKNSSELRNVLNECEECIEHGFYLYINKQNYLNSSVYFIGIENVTIEDIKEILDCGAVLYVKNKNKIDNYEEVNKQNVDSEYIRCFGKQVSELRIHYYTFDVFVNNYTDLEILIDWILLKRIKVEV